MYSSTVLVSVPPAEQIEKWASETFKIVYFLNKLLEILEISWNLIGPPGKFLWRGNNFLHQVGLIAG